MVLNEVHWELTFILDDLLGDAVLAEVFLEQNITTVLLVGQDSTDSCGVPACPSGRDTLTI